MNPSWQKSSYCSEGEACVHVAATPEVIHITESSDPTGSILTATPAAFAALLAALKNEPHPSRPSIEVTAGDADTLHLRNTDAPAAVVTTDHPKWEAFALGVRAGEFDHFVEPVKL
ncbi:DUF397 domain-containing protein [Streptomyces sp. NPDC001410]|uniref:DUF397 domain-containing protein n=1 Tax=Streptomyces sp. NPDC001410 TaxID=3364574 RepID=UPI0036CAB034